MPTYIADIQINLPFDDCPEIVAEHETEADMIAWEGLGVELGEELLNAVRGYIHIGLDMVDPGDAVICEFAAECDFDECEHITPHSPIEDCVEDSICSEWETPVHCIPLKKGKED